MNNMVSLMDDWMMERQICQVKGLFHVDMYKKKIMTVKKDVTGETKPVIRWYLTTLNSGTLKSIMLS